MIGALYNTEHPVPFPLPANKTRSGIRTQSTPGTTGFNELSFEDQAGSERVLLKAERDLEEHAQNDRLDRIDRDATLLVGRNLSRTVGGASTDVVQGARATLTFGTAVESSMGGLQRTVEGAESTVVVGDRTASVLGTESISVVRDRTVTTGARVDTAEGDATTTIMGRATLDVHDDVRVRLSSLLDVDVVDQVTLRSSRTIDIDAADGVVLRCGSSRIELRDGQIDIVSDAIRISAADLELAGGTAVLTLKDDLVATGEKVKLQSTGAELTLDTGATLKGGSVKLASGGGASHSAEDAQTHAEPTAPPELEVAVWVGVGNEATAEGELVVLDGAGHAVETRAASAAALRASGMLMWAFDPSTLPEMTTIEWRPAEGRALVLFGPANPVETRAHLDAGRTHEARSNVGRPGRRRPRPEAPRVAGTRPRAAREHTPRAWVDPPSMSVGRPARPHAGVQVTDVTTEVVDPHQEDDAAAEAGGAS